MATLVVPFFRQNYTCFSPAKVKILTGELIGDYLEAEDYYIENNGQLITDEDIFVNGNYYYVRLRVLGGKGGFGSMLRSIGAQIEKTTNREACRDLSGRRMRDINNEKRLQEWAAKAAEREQAKSERRRERRERLKAGAAKHRFDDPQYEQQKASIAENLEDAIEEGLMRAGPSGSSSAAAAATITSETEARKRKCPSTETSAKKKACQWLAVDIDMDVSSSDESNDDVAMVGVMAAASASSRTDDGGACCSHDVLPSAVDGDDAAEYDSSRSDSEDSSAAETDSSHAAVIDEGVSSQTAEITPTIVNGSSAATEEQIKPSSISGENLDLEDYNSVEDLEQLGLEVLKSALMCRGLKCGGTLRQRAERLYSVKGLSHEDIPPLLFAKPPKK